MSDGVTYEYAIYGRYNNGWDEVTAAETRKEALDYLREYRENEPGIRFVLRRQKCEVA